MLKSLSIEHGIDTNLKKILDSDNNPTALDISANGARVAGDLEVTGNIISGTSVSLDDKHPLTTLGIANDNLVEIDSADVAEDDFAQFTADGLKGMSASETLADIGGLPLAGGTMSGTINFDDSRATNVNRITMGDGGAAGLFNGVKDEDNMASNSATDVATQQSIKAYVDVHQMHSIQDRFYFDVEVAGRTYFRDIDSISYENKWDAYDIEDETVVGQTISMTTTIASAGLIVPYDCKLKGVHWVGSNTSNYDNVVYVQTWTGASIPHDTVSTTAVTATLRATTTLTNIKRKYFNVNTALDVSMSAGQMIYPAFQYVSGTAVTYSGSVIFLLEKE